MNRSSVHFLHKAFHILAGVIMRKWATSVKFIRTLNDDYIHQDSSKVNLNDNLIRLPMPTFVSLCLQVHY
jgi:hypothetical protein